MHMNIQSFLQYIRVEKRFSAHTVKAYQSDLEQFSKYLQATYEVSESSEVIHPMIRSWMVFMMESGVTSRSINRKITTLKTFFKFQLRKQELIVNPMLKVQAPKTSKRLHVFIDQSKMDILFDK